MFARLIPVICLTAITSFTFAGSKNLTPLKAQEETTPFFEEVDCAEDFPFLAEVEGVYCGYLTVEEDHFEPNGYTIDLAVIYIEGEDPSPVPILYLEGGPGGSAISAVDAWLVSPLRENHDIILYDQRGTGFSYPFLGCTEVFDLGEDALAIDEEEAFSECYNRLEEEEGIDLGLYNSAQSALDIQDLIVALELDEIDLLGVSYGTRLALTVMRDAPEGIRSVILDSVYPPQINSSEEEAISGGNAMLAVIEACMADADCNAEYPNLDETFLRVIEDLNANPTTFESEDEDGEIYTETLTGDDMLNTLFEAIYVHDYIPYVPLMIWELDQGEFEIYQLFANEENLGEETLDVPDFDYDALDEFEYLGDSDGMFYSVECTEEIPFNDIANVEELAASLPDALEIPLVANAGSTMSTCEIWEVLPADEFENQPVQSDIPTLLLAGEFDPVTPPSWAFIASEGLPNSFVYEFPALGHGVMDAGDCPMGIIEEFLADPNTEPDTSCITEMQAEFEWE